MESIASKNPKELTALLEQISGSDELKRDYEVLEEEKGKAEENSAVVYREKKTVVMERKQKKEQKEEAEKNLRLQDQLVRIIRFLLQVLDLCLQQYFFNYLDYPDTLFVFSSNEFPTCPFFLPCRNL